MSEVKLGDRSRCMTCGSKIVAVKNPHVISLTAGLWVHTGFGMHLFKPHQVVPAR